MLITQTRIDVGASMTRGGLARALVVAGAMLLSTAAGAQQPPNCVVPTFQTADNQTVRGTMTVRSGKTCLITMGLSVAGFADAQIVNAPRRGTAQIQGYKVAYTAAKGYTGPDQFTYSRYNLDRWGGRALRGVNMQVTVIP